VSEGSASIRILAVDDHALVRQGVAVLISTEPDLTLVGEASNGREAIQQFRKHRPDVTLMDLQMPGQVELTAMASVAMAGVVLSQNVRNILRRKDCIGSEAQ